MIQYSVYPMVNQFDKEAAPLYYAKNQTREVLSLESFASHIANHNTVYGEDVITGVLILMSKCMMELLLDGKKVCLGKLGDFSISLGSTGAPTASDFSANNITDVRINFTPGTGFDNLLKKATFEKVSSRKAQAATLRAEINGEDIVDLAAAKAPKPSDETPDDEEDEADDSQQGGGTTPSGSGQGGSTGSGDSGEE